MASQLKTDCNKCMHQYCDCKKLMKLKCNHIMCEECFYELNIENYTKCSICGYLQQHEQLIIKKKKSNKTKTKRTNKTKRK
jgi:hypothetical protein